MRKNQPTNHSILNSAVLIEIHHALPSEAIHIKTLFLFYNFICCQQQVDVFWTGNAFSKKFREALAQLRAAGIEIHEGMQATNQEVGAITKNLNKEASKVNKEVMNVLRELDNATAKTLKDGEIFDLRGISSPRKPWSGGRCVVSLTGFKTLEDGELSLFWLELMSPRKPWRMVISDLNCLKQV